MSDHIVNEEVTVVALPVAAVEIGLAANQRRAALEINTIEATTGPISYLITSGTAPTLASQMRQIPINGYRMLEGSDVNPGVVYILAPLGVGSVKLVEST